MGAFISDSLVLPALAVAIAGFYVPRFWANLLGEGVLLLMLNALVSTVTLVMLSAGLFVGLYVWQGLQITVLAEQGIIANIGFFGRLGLAAALIWAPIMLLSLAGLPRKWVTETW